MLEAVFSALRAIPEDDRVFQDLQDSQYLYFAGLAPAGESVLASYPALERRSTSALASVSLFRSESTSGYEIRQDLMSP